MINDLKKLLLAGVGAVATTYEKASEVVDELVEKGRLTVDEGKELSEELKRNFTTKATEKINEIKSVNKESLEKVISELGYVKKEEIDKLKVRIEFLENKLDQM
ncbi:MULTISPECIES: phasin family protein [Clostridium]|jgi:polyhydroxyalkanoate synthesis regulator phasin|uniref:Polyhydroxyalkanoate synthesis regulator phasin n=1 Tax=Clostridium intestinale DSM 6191 TaxID=1121320 RepID=A0A1M5ZD82_9CLOT|nr:MULTISPECIES: phasin family protein [Clostridium]WRY50317.1 phasin family protein [Clostridium intestinale]SHI22185.1 Polyhydroxyalkanoate synthesis regulator phasin [Clostridium intestinale DSM 6191]